MTLVHHRSGAGEPLVLLHGIGSRWRVWSPVLPLVESQREVIALDLPGFGDSAPLSHPADPDIDCFASAVEGFLDEVGLEAAHLAGNSMGGWIALELARRGRARSVTALSPAGLWHAAGAAYVRASFRLTVGALRVAGPATRLMTATAFGRTLSMSQFFGRPWRLPPEAAEDATRALVESPAFFQALRRTTRDQFRDASGIDVPVTVAWGTRDRLLPRRQAKRLLALIPQAQYVPLRGCGHVPTYDDSEAVARVLLQGSESRTQRTRVEWSPTHPA